MRLIVRQHTKNNCMNRIELRKRHCERSWLKWLSVSQMQLYSFWLLFATRAPKGESKKSNISRSPQRVRLQLEQRLGQTLTICECECECCFETIFFFFFITYKLYDNLVWPSQRPQYHKQAYKWDTSISLFVSIWFDATSKPKQNQPLNRR